MLGTGRRAPRLVDIQPDLILAFLDHLERERHNSVRSRNLRLTAPRAFLRFAGRRDVSALHVVEQGERSRRIKTHRTTYGNELISEDSAGRRLETIRSRELISL